MKLKCPRCGSDRLLLYEPDSAYCKKCKKRIPFSEIEKTLVIPPTAKMTCIHVLNDSAIPEYHESDDCYVCRVCRDLQAKDPQMILESGWLKFVHVDCLQEVLLKHGMVVN